MYRSKKFINSLYIAKQNYTFLQKLPIVNEVEHGQIIKVLRQTEEKQIEKLTNHMSYLQYDILQYMVKYYNDLMHTTKFVINAIKDDTKKNIGISFQHPLLSVSYKQFKVSNKKLYVETQKILKKYACEKNTWLHKFVKNHSEISSVKIDIGKDKYEPSNYFTYKKRYYLLDIENFCCYFYNKDNKRLFEMENLLERNNFLLISTNAQLLKEYCKYLTKN